MAKRGRKPKEKHNYFGEREEKAVLEYLGEKDFSKKNKIYSTILLPAFEIMVESIIRRYKLFIPDEEFEETFNDTLSFLLTKMDKYNPDKDCKAFSYYQTIVKNYLLGKSDNYKKKLLRYPSYEEAPEDICNSIRYSDGEKRSMTISKEILEKILAQVKKMTEENDSVLKEGEAKLGKALINLFENWDFVLSTDGSNKLNKNAILFFLRENTGMDTKGIRDNLKKYKIEYAKIKKEVIDLN